MGREQKKERFYHHLQQRLAVQTLRLKKKKNEATVNKKYGPKTIRREGEFFYKEKTSQRGTSHRMKQKKLPPPKQRRHIQYPIENLDCANDSASNKVLAEVVLLVLFIHFFIQPGGACIERKRDEYYGCLVFQLLVFVAIRFLILHVGSLGRCFFIEGIKCGHIMKVSNKNRFTVLARHLKFREKKGPSPPSSQPHTIFTKKIYSKSPPSKKNIRFLH